VRHSILARLFLCLVFFILVRVGPGPGISADAEQSQVADSLSKATYSSSKSKAKGQNPEELLVFKVEGTIMVQRPKLEKPFPLQTGSVVQKGDTLTVYDGSWVVLKTRRGDRIGLDGLTVVAIDDFYDGGPDRIVRLVLREGNILVRTQDVSSRQSFFEVDLGSVVATVKYSKATFHYEPGPLLATIQYVTGDVKVIDKDDEQKMLVQRSKLSWKDGHSTDERPSPMDELDVVNLDKFLDGEERMVRPEDYSPEGVE